MIIHEVKSNVRVVPFFQPLFEFFRLRDSGHERVLYPEHECRTGHARIP